MQFHLIPSHMSCLFLWHHIWKSFIASYPSAISSKLKKTSVTNASTCILSLGMGPVEYTMVFWFLISCISLEYTLYWFRQWVYVLVFEGVFVLLGWVRCLRERRELLARNIINSFLLEIILFYSIAPIRIKYQYENHSLM